MRKSHGRLSAIAVGLVALRGYAGAMNNESKNYHAYLLRIWPEAPGRGLPDGWRASLEDARTGERKNVSIAFAHSSPSTSRCLFRSHEQAPSGRLRSGFVVRASRLAGFSSQGASWGLAGQFCGFDTPSRLQTACLGGV